MPEERIDPSGIPQFTGNLEVLEEKAGRLKKDAKAIRETGAKVHTEFQGLTSFYDAPEAEQLFASTKPVATRADGFGDKLEKVGSALDDYAAEVRPIKRRLESLRAEAREFVSSIEDNAEWRKDEDNTTRNNDLHQDVSVAVAQFWAAERRAANRILRLVGGTPWTTDDGSGGDHMYGLSTADMKKAGETPWGKVVEREREWWEIGHHVKSFVWDGFVVDGVWEALKGLGTLVNPWGEGFGDAWSGLFDVVGGVGLYTAAPFDWVLDKTLGPDEETADEKRMKQATRDFGKAMVAWAPVGREPHPRGRPGHVQRPHARHRGDQGRKRRQAEQDREHSRTPRGPDDIHRQGRGSHGRQAAQNQRGGREPEQGHDRPRRQAPGRKAGASAWLRSVPRRAVDTHASGSSAFAPTDGHGETS